MILSMSPVKKILSYFEGLRFPWLVLVAAVLFVVNLLIPDPIPLVDELLMGLVMLALGRIRKPRSAMEGGGSKPANKG
jgi:Family of unknown function (DUF6116)